MEEISGEQAGKEVADGARLISGISVIRLIRLIHLISLISLICVISVISVLFLSVSISAEAGILDKASDKLLGRVSLICKTNKTAEKDRFGFSPNSTYNVVIRIREPGKVLAIERHANNYNHDESKGFSFLELTDKYIKLRLWNLHNESRTVLVDRYDGELRIKISESSQFSWILGVCQQGTLDSKKNF